MKRQFNKSLESASEARALLVLLLVYAIHAKRIIPTLRPHQLILPATFMQIIVLTVAALNTDHFLFIFAIGNLTVVAIALLPFLMIPPKPTAHWVKNA